MTQETFHPDARAAFRQHLQALPLPSATGLTYAAQVFAGADFAALGFRPGDYLVAGSKRARAIAVSSTELKVDSAVSGSSVAVEVPLIAWEGEVFSPKPGFPFMDESVRPVWSRVATMGAGYLDQRVLGVLTLKFPAGFGVAAIETMAGKLIQHYAPRTKLTYGSAQALVIRSERRPLLQEPDWLICPVEITIQAWTGN